MEIMENCLTSPAVLEKLDAKKSILNIKTSTTSSKDTSKEILNKFNEKASFESNEHLKSELKDIEALINDFSFEINNLEDKVKDYCINLRTEIQLETELLIQKIQDIGESMINQVYQYENECMLNLSNSEEPRFKKFCSEMKFFHSKWSKNLNNLDIDELEMKNGLKTALELKKQLNSEKELLTGYVFKNKHLRYFKNVNKLDNNLIGSIRIDNFLSIDFSNCSSYNLPDFRDVYEKKFQLDILENGKLVAFYSTKYNVIGQYLINTDYTIYKSKNLSLWTSYEFTMKAFKDNIVYSLYNKDSTSPFYLRVLNSELDKVCETRLPYVIKHISVSDTHIYCYLSDSSKSVLVYDWDLNNLKSIGNSSDLEHKFCFLNDVKFFESFDNKFYVLDEKCFGIYEKSCGAVLKQIQLPDENFFLDSNGNIMVVSVKDLKVWFLDLFKGSLSYEREIRNINENINFFYDKYEDKLIFYEMENFKIFNFFLKFKK